MSADVDALRQTDIFAGVADEHLAALANRVQHRVYEPEATIFAENDPGDAVFVIASGGVRLSKDTATNRKITLALLGEGDTFGELALFDSAPRSATAVAVEHTVCLYLTRPDRSGGGEAGR